MYIVLIMLMIRINLRSNIILVYSRLFCILEKKPADITKIKKAKLPTEE